LEDVIDIVVGNIAERPHGNDTALLNDYVDCGNCNVEMHLLNRLLQGEVPDDDLAAWESRIAFSELPERCGDHDARPAR
jgi:hypothetical protein